MRAPESLALWKAHGQNGESLRLHLHAGFLVELLLHGTAKALPVATARSLVSVAHQLIDVALSGHSEQPPVLTSASTRAGVCEDPDEEIAWEHMLQRLTCWDQNVEHPGLAYQVWLEDRKQCRAGAPPQSSQPNKRRSKSVVGGFRYAENRKALVLEYLAHTTMHGASGACFAKQGNATLIYREPRGQKGKQTESFCLRSWCIRCTP